MSPRTLVFIALLSSGCHVVLGIEEGEPLECDGGDCDGAGGSVSGGSGGGGGAGAVGGAGATGGTGGATGGTGGASGGTGGASGGAGGATGGSGGATGGTGGATGGTGGGSGGTGGSGGSGTGGSCSADTITPGFYCSTTASCNAGCPIQAPDKDSPCTTPMTCAYCTNLGSFFYIAQCNGSQWCAATVEASPC